MARTLLRPCRRLVGTATLIEAPPRLRQVRDALYLPFPGEGAWGLFADGTRIDGANRDRPQGGPPPADSPSASPRPERAPEGDYLYLGPLGDHYGHFVTDTLCRLWPLLAEPERRPRLLYHAPEGGTRWHELDFLRDLLGRLGLSTDALVRFDRPVLIPTVQVAEPSFTAQVCGHRVYRDLCQHLARGLWRPEDVDTLERPVFLSKLRIAGGIQGVEGEDELVAGLEARGVEIAFPEELSFPAQVDLFARRRRIVALAGSALHTSIFSAPRRHVVALNWSDHLNANYRITDRLNGNRAAYCHPGPVEARRADGHRLIWRIPQPGRVAEELAARAWALDPDRPDPGRLARALGGLRAAAERLLGR